MITYVRIRAKATRALRNSMVKLRLATSVLRRSTMWRNAWLNGAAAAHVRRGFWVRSFQAGDACGEHFDHAISSVTSCSDAVTVGVDSSPT